MGDLEFLAEPDGEDREGVGLVAHDRHPEGVEHLERRGKVEDHLGPGGHHDDGFRGEGAEIRGDVGAFRPATVHAADSAGREDADRLGRGESARMHRRGDRRSGGGAGHRQRAEVAVARLSRGLVERRAR